MFITGNAVATHLLVYRCRPFAKRKEGFCDTSICDKICKKEPLLSQHL